MKKTTPRKKTARRKPSAKKPSSKVLSKSKTALKTVKKIAKKAMAHSGPLGHLRDAAVEAARDTRDGIKAVAQKTGKADKEAAYEGADGIVDALRDAARNAVHKVAAALDEAVADHSPKKKVPAK